MRELFMQDAYIVIGHLAHLAVVCNVEAVLRINLHRLQ